MSRVFLTLAWMAGLIYATIPSYWLVVHPFAHKWRARKGRIYTPLGGFWLAVILVAGAVTWRWRLEALYQTAWSLLPAGLLMAIDIYLLHKIGRDFGSDRLIGRHELNPLQPDQRLITTGMHAHMRHPIYLAHLIMLLALAVGSGLAVVWALLAFAVVTGVFMIRAEDAELEKRFGEQYREYRKRVPAIGIL
jgi:protein-S-isoprenylcysteine O-methyltransferase Ste14